MNDYIKKDKQKKVKGYLTRNYIFPFTFYYMHFSLLYLFEN